MTVRAPLFLDGSNDLEEMSTAEVTSWVDYICYLYSTNPSVTLTVDTGSAGNLDAMSDTRLQAGAASTDNAYFITEGSTAEPSTVTVSYDRIHKANASISPTADSGKTWPVYQTNTGGTIQAMTLADVKDTFLFPAIDKLISGTESATTGGTYTITTSSTAASNYTNISTTPVFIDTRAKTDDYSAAGIPETLDQPTNITNYYLHRRTVSDPGFSNEKCPVYIDGDNNLKQYSEAEIEALFTEWIREVASEDGAGYQITYTVGTSGGNTRGSGMVDTKLNGSGDYQQLQAGPDDYRSQEFPNGSAATITTYALRINKT